MLERDTQPTPEQPTPFDRLETVRRDREMRRQIEQARPTALRATLEALGEAAASESRLRYVEANPDTPLARVYEQILTGQSLRHHDFAAADLAGADLHDLDLTGADFQSANLENADLSRCRLGGTKLTGVNLRGANLRGAHIWGIKSIDKGNINGAIMLDVVADPQFLSWAKEHGAITG